MYILTCNGLAVSKPHSTRTACAIEAYEMGFVHCSKYGHHLSPSVKIEQIPKNEPLTQSEE